MKKLSQFLVMAAVIVFSMAACVEEETSAVDVTGTATIKGRVFVNSDDTEFGYELANGATVRLTYNAGQLSVVNNGPERFVVLETTTNANGEYSIEVPATPKGVLYVVEVNDYVGPHKYDDGGDIKTVDADYIFNNSSNTTVRVGGTKIVDVTSSTFKKHD